MSRIPKNRTINIPASLWEKLDEMEMANHGNHITKRQILYILNEVAEEWG